MNSELTFVGEDFEYLRSIENTDPYGEIFTIIYENGLEFWRGSFSIVQAKVDAYRGTYSINPVVNDKYTPILQNWQEEVDILSILEPRNIELSLLSGIEEIEYSEEMQVIGTTSGGVFFPQNVILWNNTNYLAFSTNPAAGYNFYILNKDYTGGISAISPLSLDNLPPYPFSNELWTVYGAKYEDTNVPERKKVTVKLWRKITVTMNDIYGNPVQPQQTAGYSWYNVGAITIAGYDCTKWVLDPLYIHDIYDLSLIHI